MHTDGQGADRHKGLYGIHTVSTGEQPTGHRLAGEHQLYATAEHAMCAPLDDISTLGTRLRTKAIERQMLLDACRIWEKGVFDEHPDTLFMYSTAVVRDR